MLFVNIFVLIKIEIKIKEIKPLDFLYPLPTISLCLSFSNCILQNSKNLRYMNFSNFIFIFLINSSNIINSDDI
jgi:hypothetical protein